MLGNTWTRRMGGWAMGTAVVLGMTGGAIADDGQGSGLFGRLLRLGGNSSGSNSNSSNNNSGGTGRAMGGSGSTAGASRLPYGGAQYNSPNAGGSSFGNSLPAGGGTFIPPASMASGPASTGAPAPMSSFGGLPETPPVSMNGGGDRISPRSRVSNAVTSADPVLTRFALGKSNDGSTFGMFMQIFADGTVVDSEGVHRISQADLRPIVEATQSGEIYRLRGHCGAPSTDFIEYVHIVAYERRLGRLQAHAFSYSGNPQGCDHVIRHLHNAIEQLQTKISRPASASAAGTAAAAAAAPIPTTLPPTTNAYPAVPGAPALPSTSISTATGGPVIPLTAGH